MEYNSHQEYINRLTEISARTINYVMKCSEVRLLSNIVNIYDALKA
jgi:hypothetical protein